MGLAEGIESRWIFSGLPDAADPAQGKPGGKSIQVGRVGESGGLGGGTG